MEGARGLVPARRAVIGWVLLLVVAAAAFFAMQWAGRDLAPGAAANPLPAQSAADDRLFHLLLALAVVVASARLLGLLFRKLHQPAVIGEVLAGLLLGPSLLGRVAPDAAEFVLPPSVAPLLWALAQIGVVLYMFVVGLQMDLGTLRQRAHTTVLVSNASIVVPFALGVVLALWLFPRFAPAGVPFSVFALFIGVSMSVTAFPVLARILTDRGLHTTPVGAQALTCAAVGDVVAWCLLALLVGVVEAKVQGAAVTVVLAIGYAALMVLAARPVIVRWVRAHEHEGQTRTLMSVACVALLASALTTEAIGIHAIFGAFLLGALVPADSRVVRDLTASIENLVVVMLLPAFFAFTGLRTQVGLVSGGEAWLACALVIVVATVGKFGGAYVAARWTGIGRRDAASLGILMNTRGLMELIVLNIGLDLGVISPALFAMLVIMALVTTFATTPVLDLLRRAGGER